MCCISFYVKYFNRVVYSIKYEVCCSNFYMKYSDREL